MSNAQLEAAIEAAWEARDQITPATTGETREAIDRYGMIERGARWLVCLSGGKDSYTLLAALTELKWLACESVGQEGRAAGVPAEGHGNAGRQRAGWQLVGQG